MFRNPNKTPIFNKPSTFRHMRISDLGPNGWFNSYVPRVLCCRLRSAAQLLMFHHPERKAIVIDQ
jgi:hypothetical protein